MSTGEPLRARDGVVPLLLALGPFKLNATHIERLRLLATDFRYTLVPAEGGCVGDSVSGFVQTHTIPEPEVLTVVRHLGTSGRNVGRE